MGEASPWPLRGKGDHTPDLEAFTDKSAGTVPWIPYQGRNDGDRKMLRRNKEGGILLHKPSSS
jgi:hypothetical protein